MTDDADDDAERAEHARLYQAARGGEPGAREALADFHNRRALEADVERAAFVAANGPDPVIETVVVDGPTVEAAEYRVDLTGQLWRRGRRPWPSDPTDPSDPPPL